MQAGLTSADRRILWIGGAFLIAISVATVLISPAAEIEANSKPSTYLSTPGGARAAFLLLQKVGVQVERWQEPPMRLAAFARGTTLVLAEPTQMPSRPERRALQQFVESGGRVLFCGADLPSFFRGVQLRRVEINGQLPSEQFPSIPETAPATTIELRASAFWQQFGGSQLPVFGHTRNAVVVAWAIGQGDIIWWASATPLTNEGLSRAGNLPLFLNSVAAQTGQRVYWDEYFHGEGGSLWDYAGRVPAVRWGAFQFGLLACAVLLTFSRRSGPVITPVQMSRLSPLEFVETLGGLYRRAKAASVAVDVPYRRLRLQLIRRLALTAAISDEDLARAASGRLGWDERELRETLEQARTACDDQRISSAAALPLVQALQRFAAQLHKH